MGEKNAYLVECPRMFRTKKVVVAADITQALKFMDEEMKRCKMSNCQIESIVLIGEVLN